MGSGTAIAAILVILLAFGGLIYYVNLEKQRIGSENDIPDARVYADVLAVNGSLIPCYVMIENASGTVIGHFYTSTIYNTITGPYNGVTNPYGFSLWFSGETFTFAAMTADMSQLGNKTFTVTAGDNYITIQLQAAR